MGTRLLTILIFGMIFSGYGWADEPAPAADNPGANPMDSQAIDSGQMVASPAEHNGENTIPDVDRIQKMLARYSALHYLYPDNVFYFDKKIFKPMDSLHGEYLTEFRSLRHAEYKYHVPFGWEGKDNPKSYCGKMQKDPVCEEMEIVDNLNRLDRISKSEIYTKTNYSVRHQEEKIKDDAYNKKGLLFIKSPSGDGTTEVMSVNAATKLGYGSFAQ